jgi:mRNA-degrading endonuclease toxin of MazEF toxin-antitoxin module
MKQWEIYTYDPGFGPHPAVIVSHPLRVANKPDLEILLCSTQRASRPARETEVLLDTADGLEWETICKCDLILSASKGELHAKRGHVTPERRKQIVSTIIRSHDWSRL